MADLSKDSLQNSLELACAWLTELAQTRHKKLCDEGDNVESRFDYQDYRGAIKGEYWAATGKWSDFCPVWHTGQAVCALVQASDVLAQGKLLDAAQYSAYFILRQQITNPNDEHYGMILAYEDGPYWVGTSSILECLIGLLDLHTATEEQRYLKACDDALEWIVRRMYLRGEGLFHNEYLSDRNEIAEKGVGMNPRPLADDAMFLRVGRLCAKQQYVDVFYETLARLPKDEDPPGNWMMYVPCSVEWNTIHPRHAYWWGNPFIDAYLETKEQRYLDAAIRSGQWYISAQRTDGGLFRSTSREFRTDCFGHATSGIACAAKLWARLWQVTGDDRWIEPTRRALEFCLMMQVTSARDKNLQGIIIEKILPPDGTDASLIHIRDLGTIFYIQAVCEILRSGFAEHL